MTLLIVVLVLLAFLLSMVATAGLLVAGAVRRVRRSRIVVRGRLLARAATAPNRAARTAGRLRSRLHQEVTSAGRSIAEVGRPAELLAAHRSLWLHAGDLDRRLAVVACERDQARAAAQLERLIGEVEELARLASELRALSWQYASTTPALGTGSSVTELADTVAGLRYGLREVDRIHARSGLKGH